MLVFNRRGIFASNEVTMPYSQIAQVNLHTGLMFSRLELITTGVDNLLVHHLFRWDAAKAKKILDQKIYLANSANSGTDSGAVSSIGKKQAPTASFERSLNRLKELLHKGHISQKEFNARRAELLKKV